MTTVLDYINGIPLRRDGETKITGSLIVWLEWVVNNFDLKSEKQSSRLKQFVVCSTPLKNNCGWIGIVFDNSYSENFGTPLLDIITAARLLIEQTPFKVTSVRNSVCAKGETSIDFFYTYDDTPVSGPFTKKSIYNGYGKQMDTHS